MLRISEVILRIWQTTLTYRYFVIFALFWFLIFYMHGKGYLHPAIKELELNGAIPESLHKRTSNESLLAKIYQPVKSFVNESNILPPLINYSELFLISKKYNLATCQIEKVMSTFRNGMFCYLNRQHQFEEEGRNISTEHWSDTLCKDRDDERKSLQDALASLEKDPVIFSIIRHPFDRFLSGYVNKCINEKRVYEEKCFGCGRSMMCFLKNLKMKLSIYSDSIRNLTEPENYYVRHFAPTTWYCNLKESVNYTNFVEYRQNNRERLAADINEILERAGIHQNERAYIKEELFKQLPVHATAHSMERSEVKKEVLSNSQLYNLFMEIYYYDFIAFDFAFPQRGQIS